MSTRANIDLLGREFTLSSEGYPSNVLGKIFKEWDGNTDKLLLYAYETLRQGWGGEMDYRYCFTIEHGTLMVIVLGHSLDTIDWPEDCPAWMVQGNIKPFVVMLILSDCRYCGHLADVRPKGSEDYIGACGLGLLCGTCQKWKLWEIM